MSVSRPGSFQSYFFLTVGWISFGLGVIGVFLPILPTTPFMLLAAACFSKGSPRFHAWLLDHKIFGPPIRDWNANKVIRVQYKVLASTMMLGSIVVIFMVPTIPNPVRIGVSAFILCVMGYVLTRRSR